MAELSVCALYVKRLSDALKDRDPIRSIIHGIAVNRQAVPLLANQLRSAISSTDCK